MEESESKAKELMPMTYNTVMKELFEVRRGSWNQVQGSTIKQTQMGMGAKDQEEERLKPGSINQQPRQPWLGDQRNLGGPKGVTALRCIFKGGAKRVLLYL